MKKNPVKVAVLGGGSWATALVKILTDNQQPKQISWWLRSEQSVNHVRSFRHNPNYLSSVEIHPEIVSTSHLIENVISAAEVVLLVIPSAFIQQSLEHLRKDLFRNKVVVSAVKGLIPQTGHILGEYMQEQWGCTKMEVGVITGPCHAEEVALERLSFLTIASENNQLATTVAELLNGRYIKTTLSDDIYGTEYAAVLKNIYAITGGICHGIGYGDNFQAVLMSNAIREMKRFINAVHPINRDIDDSAYLGDLLVTGYSQFSRNRTFGNMLGKGYSVVSAHLEMNMIAEGYYATNLIYEMNKGLNVAMPILDFTYNVIYNQLHPKLVLDDLLNKLN